VHDHLKKKNKRDEISEPLVNQRGKSETGGEGNIIPLHVA